MYLQKRTKILVVIHAKFGDGNLFCSSACLGNMQNIEKISVGFQNSWPEVPKNIHFGNNEMHNIYDMANKSSEFAIQLVNGKQCEGKNIWRWKNFERNAKWFFWVMKRLELIERWQLKSFLTSWDGGSARGQPYMCPRFVKIQMLIWPLKS